MNAGANAELKMTTVTLGCRLNIAESATIAEMLATHKPNENIVVVNTCSVTADAKRKSLQAVRRAMRDNPRAKIVATGCAVETAPEAFADLAKSDGENGVTIVANQNKLEPSAWGINEAATPRAAFGAPKNHARGFLQIQQGCDHSCTFCIIPRGRGAAKDVAVDDAANLAKRLVRRGFKEVVLTGVDIASWGKDSEGKQRRLGDLVGGLLGQVPQLKRWRLSSIDPAAMDERLFNLLVGEPRLMPHVHLSIQAGDDLILKRMKRRHDRRRVIDLCHSLRAERRAKLGEEMSLGGDFICGFPTENDRHFAAGMELVDECRLGFLHVFPYSPLAATPAARMPRVPPPIAKRRAWLMRQRGEYWRQRHFRRQIGRKLAVLAETDRWGRSPCYGRVRLPNRGVTPGDIVDLRISGTVGGEFMTAEH